MFELHLEVLNNRMELGHWNYSKLFLLEKCIYLNLKDIFQLYKLENELTS